MSRLQQQKSGKIRFQTPSSKCLLCSTVTPKDIPAVKVNACRSCTYDHFQHGKLPLKLKTSRCKWNCTICRVHKVKGDLYHHFQLCGSCVVALVVQDSAAKLALVQETRIHDEKLHFLQQIDPPPLQSDFKGDVSIIVGGVGQSNECVPAHRYILASKSPVFKTMIEIDMEEKRTGKIHIEGVSAAVVRAAVNFLYMGEIEFGDHVLAEDMLGFSDQYDISWLKQICEEELVKGITTENLMKMLSISNQFKAEILKDGAKRYFREYPDAQGALLNNIFDSEEVPLNVAPHGTLQQNNTLNVPPREILQQNKTLNVKVIWKKLWPRASKR